MSPEPSYCEICGKPGSDSGYRYTRFGAQLAEETSTEMKRCLSCKKPGCDRCLVIIEEMADDHLISVYSCSDCVEKLNTSS